MCFLNGIYVLFTVVMFFFNGFDVFSKCFLFNVFFVLMFFCFKWVLTLVCVATLVCH